MMAKAKSKTMTLLATLLGAAALQGCGAPVKSAGEVASLFSGDAASLQEKISGLCDDLEARDEEPSLKGTNLKLDGCKGVGLAALNLSDIDKFQFLGLDSGQNDKANKVIHFGLRTELWLNKNLLDLAGLVGDKLQAKKDAAGDGKGLIALPDSVGKAGGPIKLELNIIEDPKFDVAKFHFGMKINIKATGIVDIDNTIEVGAQVFDGKLAAHVKTTEDQVFEKSLLKNFEALVVATPHAGDIYLDAFVDANIHSLGVGDDAIKNKLQDVISGLLKTAINGIMNLKKDGNT